tara:strand:- start:984 stop:2354 length:1371 start_codon:yes stop_codon:yes gene_type:complete
MYVSIFELFKIGIGPSSSHTVGPINASRNFISYLKKENISISAIKINLYGSLSYTGKGHGTHLGLVAGLLGYKPEILDIDTLNKDIEKIELKNEIFIKGLNSNVSFNIDRDIVFTNKMLLEHKYSNVLEFIAKDSLTKKLIKKIYYSIGGGFIKEFNEKEIIPNTNLNLHIYNSANDLLNICDNENKNIYDIIFENEKKLSNDNEENIKKKIINIWTVMNKSIYNGMQNSGTLSGSLRVNKRANTLYNKLIKSDNAYDPLDVLDWVNIFAIAVAEENASFGKIVTAPTNGAAGIIPAVIKYYKEFTRAPSDEGIIRFLLTASAIGSLYKLNASLSGADAGCQGEIGVACSMAAGGLVAAQNGTNAQIENAAEIGMEHNLGLTCDPINGLVQIPCIERNAMGSIKAINAARISLNGSGQHKVSLDEVIATMWETGKNMKDIYKETSKGGLAVNVSEC